MWIDIFSSLSPFCLFIGFDFWQWRANTNQYFGQSYYDLSKESWGWSWKERWVAVRPWEKPCQTSPSPIKKAETKQKTGDVKVALPHARKSSKVSQEEAWGKLIIWWNIAFLYNIWIYCCLDLCSLLVYFVSILQKDHNLYLIWKRKFKYIMNSFSHYLNNKQNLLLWINVSFVF